MALVDQVPVSEEQWRAAYGLSTERDVPFATLSGEEIGPLYTERDLVQPPAESIGLPG